MTEVQNCLANAWERGLDALSFPQPHHYRGTEDQLDDAGMAQGNDGNCQAHAGPETLG